MTSGPPGSGVVILGAGPAGLTAAYDLSQHGVLPVVLERDAVVGGLARTVDYKGYLFDIGGHRFYTKAPFIEQIWKDVLGDDLLIRPRLSRVYYRLRFFQYPLEAMDVLKGLGLVEVLRCGASFAKAHLQPTMPEDDLAAWVTNRFGKRLFEIFFKTYTEKVWGMPATEIRADWAAQRIRGLSFSSLVRHALPWRTNGQAAVKTLTREFLYPRRGPGMLWSRMHDIVRGRGCQVELNAPVEKIYWEPGRVIAVRAGGRIYEGAHFISSLAIGDWIRLLEPAAPASLEAAANGFHYRDFLMVALIVKGGNLFPDNWIYVQDPDVTVGRVQNFNNWSPEMSPDPRHTCLGMEYFCSENDAFWNRPDREVIDFAARELAALGLAAHHLVLDGKVIRARKAYPVYDQHYQSALATVRRFVESTLPNLQLVGRNGMHRYNNQDHSMLTAICAARNILGARIDLWRLNADADYLEEGAPFMPEELSALEDTQPPVPARLAAAAGSGT